MIQAEKANIEAARIILSESKNSHGIIEMRNSIDNIVLTVRDAVVKKKSREEINEIVSDYGLK